MRWVFWGAAGLIAYTYVGYVGWLWLRARLWPWPVLHAQQEPDVSIVMVVRNEERSLESKLRNLLELDYPAERCQIVVVSDGSTDRTEAILGEHANNPRVQVVMNQLSRGKACGLNEAFESTRGDIVVFTDARQMIESGALRLLLESFADPEVGCVSGELMPLARAGRGWDFIGASRRWCANWRRLQVRWWAPPERSMRCGASC
jgi:biofilm PGA synthesis N-glycosyltransferase PgaC